MQLSERALWCALPLLALGLVAHALTSHPLPMAAGIDWIPALGVSLSFRIDGLSALMLLMITGIGSAVFIYAGGYMHGHPGQRRLYALLSLFMLAMLVAVTADDLFVLFMAWEITSVLSFMLVGFEHERGSSRRAAQQAMLVTGGGGLAMLAGFTTLAMTMGTSSISTIVERLPSTEPTTALTVAMLLVIVGAFTKSAQWPFHFWLPNAMSAPTPVSAYLHSATMVKLGVYLLGRFDPGFGGWPLWSSVLLASGSITAVWGMLLALRERDLKRILAWSTVATLGTLVMLVGLRGEGAAAAVGALLLAHALYKAPLFFVAGNIDHGTGTRIIDELGGLRRAMPWTALIAALAGLSMAGLPMSFGYVAKDVIYEAKGAVDLLGVIKGANTIFGAIAVAVAGVAAVRVFWSAPRAGVTPSNAHEVGPSLLLPPLVLALCGLLLGIAPVYAESLLDAASFAMMPGTDPVHVRLTSLAALDLKHVAASLGVTLGIGALVYRYWDPLHRRLQRPMGRLLRYSSASYYDKLLGNLPRAAAALTRRLQHGALPGYMALCAGAMTLAVVGLMAAGLPSMAMPTFDGRAGPLGACALIVLGALSAALLRERMALMMGVGLVGYGSALLFVASGAPDVALTQFAVETVFVIVIAALLLAFRRARLERVQEPRWRPGSLLLSALFATAMTALLLVAVAVPFDDTLTRWYGENSVPAAHGHNVVNVILVDFRAIDTLVESFVVLLSFLAAAALLERLPQRPAEGATRRVMLDVVAPWLYALILGVAALALLRGHDEPGGGFVGGLLAVTATTLWAVVHGRDAARRRLPLGSPTALAALGVLLTVLAGLPALALGQPFMTHQWVDLGPWPLSTVLLFDLGVLLAVWGALGAYALALIDADIGPRVDEATP